MRRLDARGLSAQQIAERIGCSQRTVHRVRTRIPA
ncbi:helix-turn-helix domain-containing protein [Streptomyces sp. adm13(2018)]